MRSYLMVIFAGMTAIFLYNFFAFLLRSLGNSVIPLVFLAISAFLNIGLDLWFVIGLKWGVSGAAEATVIAQYVSGIGITIYTLVKFPHLFKKDPRVKLRMSRVKEIFNFSALTCLQQSIMNFGILAVQGLVNSFGTTITASFAAAVKIDAFAYLPVQDFGNAFSIFIAQNYGAKEKERIQKGIRMEQEQQERIEDMDRMWDHCSTYRNIISDQQAFRCRQCQITSRMFCQMRQIPAENQINTLFLKEMIPHHRGAVDLCQATLHFPVCRDLKRFLYSMITSQEQELRTMQQMLRCMESRTFF